VILSSSGDFIQTQKRDPETTEIPDMMWDFWSLNLSDGTGDHICSQMRRHNYANDGFSASFSMINARRVCSK